MHDIEAVIRQLLLENRPLIITVRNNPDNYSRDRFIGLINDYFQKNFSDFSVPIIEALKKGVLNQLNKPHIISGQSRYNDIFLFLTKNGIRDDWAISALNGIFLIFGEPVPRNQGKNIQQYPQISIASHQPTSNTRTINPVQLNAKLRKNKKMMLIPVFCIPIIILSSFIFYFLRGKNIKPVVSTAEMPQQTDDSPNNANNTGELSVPENNIVTPVSIIKQESVPIIPSAKKEESNIKSRSDLLKTKVTKKNQFIDFEIDETNRNDLLSLHSIEIGSQTVAEIKYLNASGFGPTSFYNNRLTFPFNDKLRASSISLVFYLQGQYENNNKILLRVKPVFVLDNAYDNPWYDEIPVIEISDAAFNANDWGWQSCEVTINVPINLTNILINRTVIMLSLTEDSAASLIALGKNITLTMP